MVVKESDPEYNSSRPQQLPRDGAGKVVKEAALPLWANLRQRVLDVAIAEINKTTDLNLEIESSERSGHRISVLTFTIKTQERRGGAKS